MLQKGGPRRCCIPGAPLYSADMLSRRVTVIAVVLSLIALAIWMALPSEMDACVDSGGIWNAGTCER